MLTLFARLVAWNLLPNGRSRDASTTSGRAAAASAAFRARLRDDLTAVLRCSADGVLTPQIAARFPLSEAGPALALAESRTVAGKVVIVPDA